MPRDQLLTKVRTALGRSSKQGIEAPPPVYLCVPEVDRRQRIADFRHKLELLAGKTECVNTVSAAAAYVEGVIAGRDAVASNSTFLEECGIPSLAGVRGKIHDPAALRDACSTVAVGITSADYALADTGTLVMIAGPAEARLISLLPPVHVAVIPADRILTTLDELFTIVPDPARITSSMVLITGPSRTADIEQILVRGVHGPGEIHVVIVDSVHEHLAKHTSD
jgi:L-lactate dehydrogenase complex protein LldG